MRSKLTGAIAVAVLLVTQVASAQYANYGIADAATYVAAVPGMSQVPGSPQAPGVAYATATDYPQAPPVVDSAVQLASAAQPLPDMGGSCATGACDMGGCDVGGCDLGGCDLGADCGCGQDCGCSIGCGTGCGCGCCETPIWAHRCGVFGEYLWIRPRNADITYAVPFNGPVTSPPDPAIQIGPVGMVDPEYEPAFRAGATFACDCWSSVQVTYTRFESVTRNSITTDAPYALRSMVAHPSTLQASSDGLDASAYLAIDFDTVNLDYRHVFKSGPLYVLNYLIGGGYAGLEQRFHSQYAVNGQETVWNHIQFNGGGIRIGFDGERHACNCGLLLYAKGTASFMAGEFSVWHAQGQAYDASVVNTEWKAGRIVPILDLELGVGWTSPKGCCRVTAGYMVSAWYNTVTNDTFMDAVQRNNFVNLSDTLTFDGLTSRIEWRF